MGTPTTEYFYRTGDDLIDGMTHGYRWSLDSSREIDYSLSNGFYGEFWYNPTSVQSYLDVALGILSYYANINFNFVGAFTNPITASRAGSEINFSLDGNNLFFQNRAQWGQGIFPDARNNQIYEGAPGDIYLNILSQANSLSSYEPGSAGWFLLLHEIGHVLGLKHPHDDGGTGRPTFNDLGIDNLDIDYATFMSYNDEANWNLIQWDPATPMILDALALQYLYGKNLATNTGPTTHQIDAWRGYYATLWDASGIDTVDASTSTSGWRVILPNDIVSTLNTARVGAARPLNEGNNSTLETLVWLLGDYENFTGSNFDDEITGTLFTNRIDGRGGSDTFELTGALSDYRFEYSISQGSLEIRDLIAGRDGTDYLMNVENYVFTDQSVNVNQLIKLSSPTVTIRTTAQSIASNELATISLTFDEVPYNFTLTDIQATGGTVEALSGSGYNYTAKFRPISDYSGMATVYIEAGSFSDLSGNLSRARDDSLDIVSFSITRATTSTQPANSGQTTAVSRVIDSDGFYYTSQNTYVISDQGLTVGTSINSGTTLVKGKKPFLKFKGDPISFHEQDEMISVFALKSGKWTEQQFSSNGQFSGVSLKMTANQLLIRETELVQDLNNDGAIGSVTRAITSSNYMIEDFDSAALKTGDEKFTPIAGDTEFNTTITLIGHSEAVF